MRIIGAPTPDPGENPEPGGYDIINAFSPGKGAVRSTKLKSREMPACSRSIGREGRDILNQFLPAGGESNPPVYISQNRLWIFYTLIAEEFWIKGGV